MDRELDKWIQEHIMGYSGLKIVYVWQDRKKKEHPIEVFSSSPDKRELGKFSAYVDEAGTKIYCRTPHGIFHIHHYIESDSDAMQVVDKVLEKFPDWSFTLDVFGKNYQGYRFLATFQESAAAYIEHGCVSAKTGPLAICLAAKEAIEGVE